MADICTALARYMKWTAISTKKHVDLNCLKQPDISEKFVNTNLKKLKKLNLTLLAL